MFYKRGLNVRLESFLGVIEKRLHLQFKIKYLIMVLNQRYFLQAILKKHLKVCHQNWLKLMH